MPTPTNWNPNTTTVYSSRGSAKEIPIGEYDKFISAGWGASAPTTAPSVQTARPAIKDVNKNIGTLDKTLEFYQKEGESTIYKDPEMTQGFKSEKEFTEAGGTPYWKPGFTGVSNVRQIQPTGNVVNDKRIAEINQTISESPELFGTGYEPTLIEITEARPDVLEAAREQGGDPYTAGTPANTWLNDWYNRTGKAEGADMVRQGILKPPGGQITPKIDTTEVIDAQDAVDNAVRAASEARESEDYTAFKKAMEDLKVSRQTLQTNLDTLYADQKKFREQYLEALKPTGAETALQSQLTDIRAEIDQVELNAKAGIDKVTQQAIPQAFVSGQSKAIANAANLTLQTQAKLEKNLIDRLGIEVGKRKTVAEGAMATLGFISSDLQVQEQIATRLQNQEDTLIDRFERYEDRQKEDAADILQALAGIDPNELSPQAMSQILNIASQLGLSPTDIIAGLQLQYDQYVLEKAKQQAALEPGTTIIETGGIQYLINSATGEIIKELGAVEQKQFAPSSADGEETELTGLAGALDEAANDVLSAESAGGMSSESWWKLVRELAEGMGLSENDANNMLMNTVRDKKGQEGVVSSGTENMGSDFIVEPEIAVGKLVEKGATPEEAIYLIGEERERVIKELMKINNQSRSEVIAFLEASGQIKPSLISAK